MKLCFSTSLLFLSFVFLDIYSFGLAVIFKKSEVFFGVELTESLDFFLTWIWEKFDVERKSKVFLFSFFSTGGWLSDCASVFPEDSSAFYWEWTQFLLIRYSCNCLSWVWGSLYCPLTGKVWVHWSKFCGRVEICPSALYCYLHLDVSLHLRITNCIPPIVSTLLYRVTLFILYN